MKYKYEHAGIAGKFRLLHKAHVELVLRSLGYTETLHIFIVDVPSYKRYASIDELCESFRLLFEELGVVRYALHVITEELTGAAWDQKLLEIVPSLEAMFDSKEAYGNLLLQNEFIPLNISSDVSVTKIEPAIYNSENFCLIAKPFRQYLTKKIVITGRQMEPLVPLIRKCGVYYDAQTDTPFTPILADVKAFLMSNHDVLQEKLATIIDSFINTAGYTQKIRFINNDLFKFYDVVQTLKEELIREQMMTETAFEALLGQLEAALTRFSNFVDYVIYWRHDDEAVPSGYPQEKLRVLPLRAPETNFSAIVETIDALLKIDPKTTK